ncbi:hypothetical protein U1Q18_037683 [Sarracenia purpurea var. burkii]
MNPSKPHKIEWGFEGKVLKGEVNPICNATARWIGLPNPVSPKTSLALMSSASLQFSEGLKGLKADSKDEFLEILRAIVKRLTCPVKYFEKVIRLSINRHGTDEGALTRAVVTGTEVDMKRS